jgi:hypothetical protein
MSLAVSSRPDFGLVIRRGMVRPCKSEYAYSLCVGPPAMPIHRFSVARLTLFASLEPRFVLGGIFVCKGQLVRLW